MLLIKIYLKSDSLSVSQSHLSRHITLQVELVGKSSLLRLTLSPHDGLANDLKPGVPLVLFDQIEVEDLLVNLLDKVGRVLDQLSRCFSALIDLCCGRSGRILVESDCFLTHEEVFGELLR